MKKVTFQIGLKIFLWLNKKRKQKKTNKQNKNKTKQKTKQKEFRVEKEIKKKGDKLYVKWKYYDSITLIVRLIKKI